VCVYMYVCMYVCICMLVCMYVCMCTHLVPLAIPWGIAPLVVVRGYIGIEYGIWHRRVGELDNKTGIQ
jgi:hypothetical protein